MAALTVRPGVAESGRLEKNPRFHHQGIEVETLLVGLCGTDREIVEGSYGAAAHGRERLIIGHEAVGRVVEAHDDSGFAAGDLVVPMVRRPDPVPCPSCAVGELDMCQNGRYTEHGIKGADGFARDRFPLDPAYAVAVPEVLDELAVLTEPASVVAKAWEQIERIGARAHWSPARVLVTGAGPIGLLAALMARQRGFEVAVFDRATVGPKPDLVGALGATFHIGDVDDAMQEPDVVLECTGAASVVFDVIGTSGPTGIVCLAGLSSGHRTIEIEADAVNRQMVLENLVVFGTVNANRRHYQAAVESLVAADPNWLRGVITRRVALEDWQQAFERRPDDVKIVLDVG